VTTLSEAGSISLDMIGAPNGVAGLDQNARVPFN